MKRSLFAALMAMAIVAGACGADPSSGTSSSTTIVAVATTTSTSIVPTTKAAPFTTTTTAAPVEAFPVTVVGGNGDVFVAHRPEAIVSLSPTATEMLFAIGAGEQVVAADSLSDYPAEAPTTDLSAFEPNVEAIAEFEPDLVVLSFDPGDVVVSLEALGIPTLVQFAAANIEETYGQMSQLGMATGNMEGAVAAISEIEGAIVDIVASLPETDEPVTYYHELDSTYYSVATSTFIGEVYGLLGLVSIADEAADLNFGYPQLSAEFILEADPDLILLADTICCGQSIETVNERDGWGELSAVQAQAVVELDDSVASRWGPRIVDLLIVVSEAVGQLSAAE